MTNNIENTVEEVKQGFNDYFKMVGGTKFRQFYYDWHIDNMLAPFAGLLVHFHKTYDVDGAKKFAEFVDEVAQNVADYNNDKPQLSLLKTSDYAGNNEHRLTALLNGVEAFGFDFRQFVYSFAAPEDHQREFGGWSVKPNMPYSNQYGLMVGRDILEFLKQNYSEITRKENVYQRALYAADVYLRRNVTKGYPYQGEYNFTNRRKNVQELRDLRNQMYREYRINAMDETLKDMFQVEDKGLPPQNGYLPCGFELEFYVPEEYGDYGKLIDYLKVTNGWKKIYSSNKDSSVYMDEDSAGVIMRDESLTRYNGLAAVEYASSVMRNKNDEQRCLKIMEAFDEGHVNVHCSLHQHLSAAGFTLDTYKRLVKRMMQHESEIVSAFAAPERRDNKLLYATYISRNLSNNSERDYPFLCVMVDLCADKKQLEEMSAFGHKYKTLNILPDKTVEMRFMNANFNKRFVEAFLQFNREFVSSAVANAPQHINRLLLNKYNWHNNCQSDEKTVQHKLPYYYQVAYDTYSPMKRGVTKEVVEGEQTYARLVMQALNETKKLQYINPSYNKKLREVLNRGR
ncbi:MAG: amidoligase family protein [Acetobacter sp.]|nr:amidoligase family protein [Acetobacter sp.]